MLLGCRRCRQWLRVAELRAAVRLPPGMRSATWAYEAGRLLPCMQQVKDRSHMLLHADLVGAQGLRKGVMGGGVR